MTFSWVTLCNNNVQRGRSAAGGCRLTQVTHIVMLVFHRMPRILFFPLFFFFWAYRVCIVIIKPTGTLNRALAPLVVHESDLAHPCRFRWEVFRPWKHLLMSYSSIKTWLMSVLGVFHHCHCAVAPTYPWTDELARSPPVDFRGGNCLRYFGLVGAVLLLSVFY